MFYKWLKLAARLAIRFYCRKIIINNPELLNSNGPLLIAANHPDSFLDAIILATLFEKPVYSLTRGDIFSKKVFAFWLGKLKMMPVYRISEGAENLQENYETFEKCKNVFRNNGIILIFSEGACINEWKLRPLKKGTARLVMSSWEAGIDLKILPAGINYQSFTSFGKNVQLNFGNIITKENTNVSGGYGNTIKLFNEKLSKELSKQVIEIESSNTTEIRKIFAVKNSIFKRTLLLIPAAFGYLFHALLYLPVQKFAWRKAAHIDHYDSVLVGMLFLLYPFYLVGIALLIYWLTGWLWWIAGFFVFPFCAWAFVQVKRQF